MRVLEVDIWFTSNWKKEDEPSLSLLMNYFSVTLRMLWDTYVFYNSQRCLSMSPVALLQNSLQNNISCHSIGMAFFSIFSECHIGTLESHFISNSSCEQAQAFFIQTSVTKLLIISSHIIHRMKIIINAIWHRKCYLKTCPKAWLASFHYHYHYHITEHTRCTNV